MLRMKHAERVPGQILRSLCSAMRQPCVAKDSVVVTCLSRGQERWADHNPRAAVTNPCSVLDLFDISKVRTE